MYGTVYHSSTGQTIFSLGLMYEVYWDRSAHEQIYLLLTSYLNVKLGIMEIENDMVQGFGVFRNSTPPTAGEVGKVLWGCVNRDNDLTDLYNVFA